MNNLQEQIMDSKGYLFKETREFTEQNLKELFKSVGWLSANYPERLVTAMQNSSTVLTVWDKDSLIGLVSALDDGELTAYIHYLLIHPDYQGKGVGKELLQRMKEKYKNYLYLILISEEKKNVAFYKKNGFEVCEGATPMQIRTI